MQRILTKDLHLHPAKGVDEESRHAPRVILWGRFQTDGVGNAVTVNRNLISKFLGFELERMDLEIIGISKSRL